MCPYLTHIVFRQSERGVCRQPDPILAGETHERVETALPGVHGSVLLSPSLRSPDHSLTQTLLGRPSSANRARKDVASAIKSTVISGARGFTRACGRCVHLYRSLVVPA